MVFIVLFWDVSYSPGWPGACYVAEAGLEPLVRLPTPLTVLGLQACATWPRSTALCWVYFWFLEKQKPPFCGASALSAASLYTLLGKADRQGCGSEQVKTRFVKKTSAEAAIDSLRI